MVIEHGILILVVASIGGFFMAFSNGANDVANAFASAVGSKAISVKQAVIIAAILNFFGAVLLGSHVASTLIEKVISPDFAIHPHYYITGMIACLIASCLFVLLSTFTGMPVSSTHTIVGSLTGVVIVLGGFSVVNWHILLLIGISWLTSPFLAGVLAWSSIKIIKRFVYGSEKKRIMRRFRKRVPVFIGLSVTLLAYSVLKRSELGVFFDFSIFEEIIATLALGLLAYYLVSLLLKRWARKVDKTEKGGERLFRKLQVGTSCYVAFAHGSNDVSNSISPLVAIYMVLKLGKLPPDGFFRIPLWTLFLGGAGMALGIALLGHKVMATLGKKITLLTNSRGFSVDFATATTVILASVLGMPVSSTHAVTGSIVGVGLENRKRGLNLSILIKILITWIITVPCAAIITMAIFMLLKLMFLPDIEF